MVIEVTPESLSINKRQYWLGCRKTVLSHTSLHTVPIKHFRTARYIVDNHTVDELCTMSTKEFDRMIAVIDGVFEIKHPLSFPFIQTDEDYKLYTDGEYLNYTEGLISYLIIPNVEAGQ